ILSHLKEERLSHSEDKIAYIERVVAVDVKAFAKDILSVLRMSTQIGHEYNVIDYLKPNIQLVKSEFGRVKVHKLLVGAFYQFDVDFKSKNIFVKIFPTMLSVFVNYNTVRTLLTHVFTNALRYCMPDTEIRINTQSVGQFVQISFEMRSLYLTNRVL